MCEHANTGNSEDATLVARLETLKELVLAMPSSLCSPGPHVNWQSSMARLFVANNVICGGFSSSRPHPSVQSTQYIFIHPAKVRFFPRFYRFVLPGPHGIDTPSPDYMFTVSPMLGVTCSRESWSFVDGQTAAHYPWGVSSDPID